MTRFDMDIQGLEQHQQQLEDKADEWSQPSGSWYVGTAVSYAVYVEFGTSKMDARPFFRPALVDAKRDLSAFVRENTKKTLQQIDSPSELVRVIAYALERRVKEIITEKGLIQTGTMRASVKAVKGGPSALPDEDDVDPDAAATAEVGG